mmetsp:Transcript_23932/g.48407  ORF Transcript_23932/g.48407 Transcript_23932/m.48407 type:complete len:281 (+) Transcript_23932:111-953(+)
MLNTKIASIFYAMSALRLGGAFIVKPPSITSSKLISSHKTPRNFSSSKAFAKPTSYSRISSLQVSLSVPPNKRQVTVTFTLTVTAQSTIPPRPLVICGCSGVGKGTLIDLIRKKYPDQFGFSVSHTTRKPREGEIDGVHYNFITIEEIHKAIEDGKFLEYAEVHGNYYGTSLEAVQNVQKEGKICILDIDVQGVQNVKTSGLDAFYVFIAPPSMKELEKRLRGRGTETEEAVLKRLGNARKEVDYGLGEGNFDKIFNNDDIDRTLEEMSGQFENWYPQLL